MNILQFSTKIVVGALLSVALLASTGSGAMAAKPPATNTASPLGLDVSWPQCGKTLPTDQAFGIVGVNGGLANNSNQCFTQQLTWAQRSKGGTGQPLAALYVNTANPGALSASWPTSNNYKGVDAVASIVVANPYGDCTGAEDAACAYVYGWSRAYDDANFRNVPTPGSFKWWLDVETGNSWSSTNLTANAADLEGMTDYFKSLGAQVGIYSTNYQWTTIVGQVASTSSLSGLDSWLAGARTSKAAQQNCTNTPLTPTSKVTLTQFVSNNLDYDYSCI
jgi:hypothetical protein